MNKVVVNSFAIEGKSGKELYDFIMSGFNRCNKNETTVEIGVVENKHYCLMYKINDLPWDCDDEYELCVYDNCSELIGKSKIDNIEYKNDVLYLKESSLVGKCVISEYIRDRKIYNESGFYFFQNAKDNSFSKTNDVWRRYFKPWVKMTISDQLEKSFDNIREFFKMSLRMRNYFNALSFEAQLEYCKVHNGIITYVATEFIDARVYWNDEIAWKNLISVNELSEDLNLPF